MRLSTKRKTTTDDVRRVALAALASALDDRKEEAKRKPGLTGVRAVATGAVLYTAGKAAFTGRRFVREHFGSDGAEDRADEDEEEVEDDEPRAEAEEEEYEEDEEPEAEAEEDEEPEAEFDEDDEPEAEAEEDEEPEAEADEDEEPEAEADEEPEAEEDVDDYEEDEPRRKPKSKPRRRSAALSKRDLGGVPSIELPSRPSRPRPSVRT